MGALWFVGPSGWRHGIDCKVHLLGAFSHRPMSGACKETVREEVGVLSFSCWHTPSQHSM